MSDASLTPTDAPAPRTWRVIKLRPDGSRATTYPGVEIPAPPGWVAVEARWVFKRVDIGYYAFEPGDRLLEFFALDQPYNAFGIWRADGTFVGWYCNVTFPTTVTHDSIWWHDLYVDVIVTADGSVHVVDEDELAEADVIGCAPQVHAMILRARDELLRMIARGAYPFGEAPEPVVP